MAAYHNRIDTLLFGSQSPSGSKHGELNENGYGELQNTAVFYDTLVPDSPVSESESRLETVCFDTEVVDEDDLGNLEDTKGEPESVLCEFDMEIVLDSEDEGTCRTKVENLLSGSKTTGISEKKAVKKREGQSPCLDADSNDKQFDAGKKESSIKPDGNDGKKCVPQLSVSDHEIGTLEHVDSQEPEESTFNALCFVDNFLTFNNVDMCQGVEERTTARKKSPLVPSAKGTRRLAKVIRPGSPVKEMGSFEWFESYQHGEADSFVKRTTTSSEFGDFKQRTDKRHQNLPNRGERSLRNQQEGKKEFADPQKNITGPSHSHSISMDKDLKVSIRTGQESEKNLTNGSVEELDKHMKTESSWEKFEASGSGRDIPDTFDVGISTQIAAEAMEALFYGPPAGCVAGDTCDGLADTFSDLPEGETKRRTHLEQHSLQNLAAYELGEVAKESIQRKCSARRYNKEVSSSSWNFSGHEFNPTVKSKPYECKQSKVYEAISSNKLNKFETYASPLFPNEQTLLRKQLSWEEPITRKTVHWEGEATMKRTKDQPDKRRALTKNFKDGSMLTYKRKRKRVVSDPPKLLIGKQKCSKLHSNASTEALDGKLSEQWHNSPQEAAIVRFLRLHEWNCPKGKRTNRKVSIHSSGESNMHASLASVGAQEHNLHSGSQKMQENDETASNNFNVKRHKCTALYQPSLKSNSDESLSRENSNEVTGVVTNSDSAVTSIRISASDLDRAKAVETGKLNYVDFTSIINDLKNHSFGKSLRKSIESSGTECNSTVSCTKSVNEASLKNNIMPYIYHRRPRNKNLPKPSLLKELTALGVPESISDFTRKGFRRRKEMAYVRVLFSQHLDNDVIKQQKKISARLGISITTCSMDATHFIADEFVRTRNMLEAIALGKPVVTHLWLDSCAQASCLLDEKPYILRDSKREKEIGFSMPVSLAHARLYPLLKDKRVFITQNVKPNKETITSLVKAVGGEVLETSEKLEAEDRKMLDDLLILSCEEDQEIYAPLLDKDYFNCRRSSLYFRASAKRYCHTKIGIQEVNVMEIIVKQYL
ncbi:hypothetical protein DITRI_Ditri13aG0084000 [Diplodiscus trichospermus]